MMNFYSCSSTRINNILMMTFLLINCLFVKKSLLLTNAFTINDIEETAAAIAAAKAENNNNDNIRNSQQFIPSSKDLQNFYENSCYILEQDEFVLSYVLLDNNDNNNMNMKINSHSHLFFERLGLQNSIFTEALCHILRNDRQMAKETISRADWKKGIDRKELCLITSTTDNDNDNDNDNKDVIICLYNQMLKSMSAMNKVASDDGKHFVVISIDTTSTSTTTMDDNNEKMQKKKKKKKNMRDSDSDPYPLLQSVAPMAALSYGSGVVSYGSNKSVKRANQMIHQNTKLNHAIYHNNPMMNQNDRKSIILNASHGKASYVGTYDHMDSKIWGGMGGGKKSSLSSRNHNQNHNQNQISMAAAAFESESSSESGDQEEEEENNLNIDIQNMVDTSKEIQEEDILIQKGATVATIDKDKEDGMNNNDEENENDNDSTTTSALKLAAVATVAASMYAAIKEIKKNNNDNNNDEPSLDLSLEDPLLRVPSPEEMDPNFINDWKENGWMGQPSSNIINANNEALRLINVNTNTKSTNNNMMMMNNDDNNDSNVITMAKELTLLQHLERECRFTDEVLSHKLYDMGDDKSLFIKVSSGKKKGEHLEIEILSDVHEDNLSLHWGVTKNNIVSWVLPPQAIRNKGTKEINDIAVETEFKAYKLKDNRTDKEEIKDAQRLKISIPTDHKTDISGLTFVIRNEDGNRWWKDGHSDFNFLLPIESNHEDGESSDITPTIDELTREIVQAEQSSEWTLMHRYNKIADILECTLKGNYGSDWAEPLSKLFVLLRYSTTRQLTWQRNYNTQPRILASAQDRVTEKITDIYTTSTGEAKEWARLMLTCVGRGGDGQKIRDDILHIMHNNDIPEKKGTWMEEWHQKLHNNTTPDDIGICEAYIAFLENDGDNASYWKVLSDHGISKERLESLDRPICCEPEDFPKKRDALIVDFKDYLEVIQAVHSGADLNASIKSLEKDERISTSVKDDLEFIKDHRKDTDFFSDVLCKTISVRQELRPYLDGNRDIIYLDFALEDIARGLAEQSAGDESIALQSFGNILKNLCLSIWDNEEVCYNLQAWETVTNSISNRDHGEEAITEDEALRMCAVVDRIRNSLTTLSDKISTRIQSKAEAIGRPLDVEKWRIDLFAEETIRGSAAFAVSLLLTQFESKIRKVANLSPWQVISPGVVQGVVEHVASLSDVQEKVYSVPTILISDEVTGEEEVPEGVVGVVTLDAPDVLSHIAVRARNMKVFLSTSYEKDNINKIASSVGKMIQLESTTNGEVLFSEMNADDVVVTTNANDNNDNNTVEGSKQNLVLEAPEWCGKYTVSMDEYQDGIVGAKSKNLSNLRGQLPDWIHLPSSFTMPFGTFEEVLKASQNRKISDRINTLMVKICDTDNVDKNGFPLAELSECRKLVMDLKIPDDFQSNMEAQMNASNITWPTDSENNKPRWEDAFHAMKSTWASKFNDRAYFSMRKAGLNMENLRMAVLVQKVIPAAYAFVIHTKNPSTNNDNEIYAEIVIGLGETLVGNFTGRALSFVINKKDLKDIRIESYPSKSVGLFVPDSLIFRSDSNGEDLDGYAGAGLYDSITMDQQYEKYVDYTTDLIWLDDSFRQTLCEQVGKVGAAIENALGSAQDIEGVIESNGKITVVQTRPQV